MGAGREEFLFRDLHPGISMGTASDRYAGWIGQIYTAERYADRVSRRARPLAGKSFTEEVLPVDSVEEYFEHFGVLELDYTFYRFLLDSEGRPTQNYHVLGKYRQRLKDGDALVLKAPREVFAQKIRRRGGFAANEAYLDPDAFLRRFYEPAVELLGASLTGIVFEQEYQRRQDRISVREMATSLDAFFTAVPRDTRYNVELRTEIYLAPPVFEVLEKHGVGQVLSHWTWLPRLREQFARSGSRFVNSGGQAIVRLMTPRGVRYEDAYARAHPFDRLLIDMISPGMVEDTVDLMYAAIDRNVRLNVIVNNRSGGNAPLVAKRIADEFSARQEGVPSR